MVGGDDDEADVNVSRSSEGRCHAEGNMCQGGGVSAEESRDEKADSERFTLALDRGITNEGIVREAEKS